MSSWGAFFGHLFDWLAMLYDVGYVPLWNLVKTAACGWIATSIVRFKMEPDMSFKIRETLAATALFVLCIMELSRVFTGISVGVSPFVSLILMWLAYRLHWAKGNIANLRLA